MNIVYMSLTGQTHKFIEKVKKKISINCLYIKNENDYIEINENFICIIPTYDKASLSIIESFIEYKNNKSFLRGVVGSGNRNFNTLFCISAKYISDKYAVPLLHCFEFQGSEKDVDIVISEVKRIG